MSLLLTPTERNRFASWLEHEARIDEAMAKQMDKINVPEAAIKKYLVEATAAIIIAAKLRSIEEG